MRIVPLPLRLYVASVAVVAAFLAAAVARASGTDIGREWLVLVFAALIALEHVFESRLVREGEQGETTTHEESFLVALALLAPPLAVVAAFAGGFLAAVVLKRLTD